MTKQKKPDLSKLDKPEDLFGDDYGGFKEFPSHIATLYENWNEVLNLVEIQDDISRSRRSYIKKIEVLNKSAIILLVASWESFIEDLAKNAFDHLINNANSPKAFPNKVLSLAGKEIHEDKDRTQLWALAGEGWKDVLKKHRKNVLAQYIGKLNSPKQSQVDNLFLELIGFKKISSYWKWRGMPNKNSLIKLEELIHLRGEIAHRVQSTKKVSKNDIVNYAKFISRISVISSNHINGLLWHRTDKQAWKLLRIGETYL